MTTVGILVFGTAIVFVLVQGSLIYWFASVLRSGSQSDSDGVSHMGVDVSDMNVAVVLCVRGADPTLESCLRSLAEQDHPHKKIFVVGDSDSDPGVGVARKVLSKCKGLEWEVHITDTVHSTCGLKCSNLISLLNQLPQSFDVYALVDADTCPTKEWLGQMLRPLTDNRVAVATGIRWFDPVGSKLGTWVRFIWNAAAIVQMVCYRIPWGGSLVIRAEFYREAAVGEAWRQGFCEDTMLPGICESHGAKIAVVPQAIIATAEETTWRSAVPWIGRQLLTTRLHHPRWPLVLGHGMVTFALTIVAPMLAVVLWIAGSTGASVWIGAGWLVAQVGNYLLLSWILVAVFRARSEAAPLQAGGLRLIVPMLLTQFAYAMAIWKACFRRKVEWRQIEYRLHRGQIEMVRYLPFQPRDGKETVSL